MIWRQFTEFWVDRDVAAYEGKKAMNVKHRNKASTFAMWQGALLYAAHVEYPQPCLNINLGLMWISPCPVSAKDQVHHGSWWDAQQNHCIMFYNEFGPRLILGRAGMTHDGNTLREWAWMCPASPSMCFRHESCQPCLEPAKDQVHYGTLWCCPISHCVMTCFWKQEQEPCTQPAKVVWELSYHIHPHGSFRQQWTMQS